ncbi:DUF3034 family protein [Dyella ginsengisoli]|uniref:DUF3034 family protein n=1 Tax=Dyella ginsengisoli TaxID=363848 RepID=A0ABW8JW66_9GAMM
MRAARGAFALLACLLLPALARAGDGRLLATGGASMVEGSAGGGLVPWAVLSGYATREQVGATAFVTRLDLPDYRLDAHGAAFTWHNRLELSVARDRFDLGTLGEAIGMPGAALRQDVFGAKLRLTGDAVYGPLPQISLGVQHKHNLDFAIPKLVGARRDRGTDVYLSATQVLLAGAAGYNLLWNVTLRSTDANQLGLLGFGGDRGGRRLVGEGSLALLLDPHVAVGAEYRQKPDQLSFARENNASDLFVAWFPSKHVSLVAAYVSLGEIAGLRDQRGWYLSLQGSL